MRRSPWPKLRQLGSPEASTRANDHDEGHVMPLILYRAIQGIIGII